MKRLHLLSSQRLQDTGTAALAQFAGEMFRVAFAIVLITMTTAFITLPSSLSAARDNAGDPTAVLMARHLT